MVKQISDQIASKVNDVVQNNPEVKANFETSTGESRVTPQNYNRLNGAINSSSPNAQNAFYNDFLNKTIRQVVLDLDNDSMLNNLINKFGIGTLVEGNKIEVVTSGTVLPVNLDYTQDATNDPYGTKKNKM